MHSEEAAQDRVLAVGELRRLRDRFDRKKLNKQQIQDAIRNMLNI